MRRGASRYGFASAMRDATLSRVHRSKLRGWNGHQRDIGDGQRGTKASGITTVGINDDVGVLGLHLENLCPNVGAGEGNGSIAGCAQVFGAQCREISCRCLIIGVDQ